MMAEKDALVYAADDANMAREMIEGFLGREISFQPIVDSRSLYNVFAKDSRTAEWVLALDVFELVERYRRAELKRAGWILGMKNVTNVITNKHKTRNSTMWC